LNVGACVVDTVGKNVPQVSTMPEKIPEIKNLMTLSRQYVHDGYKEKRENKRKKSREKVSKFS
jgi:hypothetical protein